MQNQPVLSQDINECIKNIMPNNSHWITIYTELRLITNALKHEKGRSYEELKSAKPKLFIDISAELPTISLENLKNY